MRLWYTIRMEKIHIVTFINAPREKVWHAMLDDAAYRDWTSAFNPGSYYKGEWKEGSKMLFLGPDPKTGKEGGMVSMIREVRPNEFVGIDHLGLYQDGIEVTEGNEVEGWAGASENYTFSDKDGGTELAIDMEIKASERAMMEDMWKKALVRLKELAEG